jgi:hypothetical protein
LFHITTRFVHIVEESHLTLYQINKVVDVFPVPIDKFLLFLKDLFNDLLVIVTQLFRVGLILVFQLLVGRHSIT